MSRANYKCPQCGGRLKTSGADEFECSRCSETVREVVAENRETLEQLADSDLSCAWIAESLLDVEVAGGDP